MMTTPPNRDTATAPASGAVGPAAVTPPVSDQSSENTSAAPSGVRAKLWQILTTIFLSPIVWLLIVQSCMVASLWTVGYLSAPEQGDSAKGLLKAVLAVPRDSAAHRAGLAYSGITLGLTWALAVTSVVWAVSAFMGWRLTPGRSGSRRGWGVLVAVVGVSVGFYVLLNCLPLQPFPTAIGEQLLQAAYSAAPAASAVGAGNLAKSSMVPTTMFILAFLVPAVLAAGAGFLGERIEGIPAETLMLYVRLRLRELDHLLYIGALAMVFGILQLSTTMSVPLASLPKTADLKSRADLCKTLAPNPASSPFLSETASLPEETISVQACRQLSKDLALDERAGSLRQLVRSVTLAMGLAFSAMLIAIYVPALVALRTMVEPVIEGSAKGSDEQAKPSMDSVGEVDPLRRIATAAATLGPFIAGLVANAYGGA